MGAGIASPILINSCNDVVEARTGFGLGNMRRRSEEMGGTCSTTSEEGMGTDIRVTLPIAS